MSGEAGQMKKWKVWTGHVFEETTAVSAIKAINNIAWRMRQRGMFAIRSRMSAEEVKA